MHDDEKRQEKQQTKDEMTKARRKENKANTGPHM